MGGDQLRPLSRASIRPKRDAALFAKPTNEAAALQAKLSDAEEQWLTLEMKREEAET